MKSDDTFPWPLTLLGWLLCPGSLIMLLDAVWSNADRMSYINIHTSSAALWIPAMASFWLAHGWLLLACALCLRAVTRREQVGIWVVVPLICQALCLLGVYGFRFGFLGH